jgi:hypothetical protein
MIYPNALSAEDVKEISHEALRQYAFASGWREVASPSPHFALMHPTQGSEAQMLIPLRPDFVDYERRIMDAIYDLARKENVSIVQMMEHLRGWVNEQTLSSITG